jgi:murein DD-endopeptidase MepM/ murein hydrolase activator NlpD
MVIALLMIVAFPWFDKPVEDSKLYVVTVNGVKVGTCENIEEINKIYIETRTEVETSSSESVYMESKIEFVEYDSVTGKPDKVEDIKNAMHKVLSESTVETKKQAYVVDIDGLTITLGSEEEVSKLLNAAKAKYDTENRFDTVLYNDDSSRFANIAYEIISADILEQYTDNVMAAIGNKDGSIKVENENELFDMEDSIIDISFKEKISITETYVNDSHIMNLDEAINLVTKEREENKIYEVVAGDTLSGIASKYELTLKELLAMNPDFSETGLIRIGDLITVTVPEPELSVIVTEQKSYEEEYELPIRYVYNSAQYTTYSKVVDPGTTGHRHVVAKVTYTNGVQTGIEIIAQRVDVEAKEKVVEVGTKTPPTYIKPISGGISTSKFGWRSDPFTKKQKLHGGHDWAVSTGTTVVASSAGTIVEAGWNGSYGYNVLISHPDGRKTRYAHLSKVNVKVGQKVSQGQIIGRSGNTGRSTGPHLHFEMYINGVRVDPLKYIG